MKFSVLKLQRIMFILQIVFVFGFFIATVIFTTSLYDTYLYGNLELTDYYTIELQVYNKTIFNFALVLVILFLICAALKPTKYYPTLVTYPIFVLVFITGIVLGILCTVKMQPIMKFYEEYDYSSISRLANYEMSYFFPIFTNVTSMGLVVASTASIGVYTFGFLKFLKRRGELNGQEV